MDTGISGLFDPRVMEFSFSGNEEDPLFMSDGLGHFVDQGYQARTDLRGDGRSSAFADLDGDGDLDLVVRQLQKPKLVVLRNDLAPDAGWLEVAVEGTRSNRMGIGAKVEACVERVDEALDGGASGRACQEQEIHAGQGFLSQSPPLAHFGLGPAHRLTRLSVRWPSGLEQAVEDLPADRRLRWKEGEAAPVAAPSRHATLGRPAPGALSASGLLGPGDPRDGRPTLVNLWEPGCIHCRDEAAALADYQKVCGGRLRLVAASVEQGADPAAAAKLGIPWPLATIDPRAISSLDWSLDGPGLPTTLAFDGEGRLTGGVVGPVTLDALKRLMPCPGLANLQADGGGASRDGP